MDGEWMGRVDAAAAATLRNRKLPAAREPAHNNDGDRGQ